MVAYSLPFQADVSKETIQELIQRAVATGSLNLFQRGDRLSVTMNPHVPQPPPGNQEEEGLDGEASQVPCY